MPTASHGEDCFEIQVAHFVADDRFLLIVESTGQQTSGDASGGSRYLWDEETVE